MSRAPERQSLLLIVSGFMSELVPHYGQGPSDRFLVPLVQPFERHICDLVNRGSDRAL
jgi:hypothetical protein